MNRRKKYGNKLDEIAEQVHVLATHMHHYNPLLSLQITVCNGTDGEHNYGADTTTREVIIADIANLAVNQTVEVVCKVHEVKDVQVVKRKHGDAGKELHKQDVVIGDVTKSCRLVLWEDVNSVEEGKCYGFVGVGVRQFLTVKYLTYTASSTKELEEGMEDVNEERINLTMVKLETSSVMTVRGNIVSSTPSLMTIMHY